VQGIQEITVQKKFLAARTVTTLSLVLALAPAASAWPQQGAAPTAIPTFPPGPGYAGVAGTPEESARITSLCGKNRNAADGYFAPPAVADQTRAPILAHKQPFKVEVVTTIDRSIGLAFLPNGDLLVSQRAGGMRTVHNGVVSEPLTGAPKTQQTRLSSTTDVLLDHDFAKNRTLYYGFVLQPSAPGQPLTAQIVKAKLSADERSLEGIVTLHEAHDFTPRRLVQARDGSLLITSAEVASGGPNPQSLQKELGKVLRINTDGTIPKDNPFLKTPGADPALYAVGFRDIQGAALDPKTGKLWVGENTPMGGDELNLIKPGGNYGFPVISYGRENSGALINGGKTAQDGMEQPVYYWTPSIAPSGMTFYDGKALSGWKDSIFVGAMSGLQLVRLQMKNGRVVGEEKLLMDRCKRIKDVRESPDGLIYVITDESPSEILRPTKDKPATH
jgi:glucose/arabinose dehydrogenase